MTTIDKLCNLLSSFRIIYDVWGLNDGRTKMRVFLGNHQIFIYFDINGKFERVE